jgi:hypothetical protein
MTNKQASVTPENHLETAADQLRQEQVHQVVGRALTNEEQNRIKAIEAALPLVQDALKILSAARSPW